MTSGLGFSGLGAFMGLGCKDLGVVGLRVLGAPGFGRRLRDEGPKP